MTSKKGALEEQQVPEKQPVFLQPQNGEETITGNFNIEAQNQPMPVNEKIKEKVDLKAKEIAPSVASSKQKFIIQVASLKGKTKATKIIKKIDSLGFTSQIDKIESKGKGSFISRNCFRFRK